jgi:hypothetical protein
VLWARLIAETCLPSCIECKQACAPTAAAVVRPRQGNNKGLKRKQKAAAERGVNNDTKCLIWTSQGLMLPFVTSG